MNEDIKTEAKHCRKCTWCTRMNTYDVLTDERGHSYYCTFGKGIDGKATIAPTLDEKCPHFQEPYHDDEEEEGD